MKTLEPLKSRNEPSQSILMNNIKRELTIIPVGTMIYAKKLNESSSIHHENHPKCLGNEEGRLGLEGEFMKWIMAANDS